MQDGVECVSIENLRFLNHLKSLVRNFAENRQVISSAKDKFCKKVVLDLDVHIVSVRRHNYDAHDQCHL